MTTISNRYTLDRNTGHRHPQPFVTAAENRQYDWQNRREAAETYVYRDRQATQAISSNSNPYAAYMAFNFQAR